MRNRDHVVTDNHHRRNEACRELCSEIASFDQFSERLVIDPESPLSRAFASRRFWLVLFRAHLH